jgi:hypothetical protein
MHQIHTTGEASGSTTMVMVFVMLFLPFVLSHLVIITRRLWTSTT